MSKDQVPKLYYSIGEVADLFDVSTSLIRFWETEFDILKPKKNRKGDRRFTQKDIDSLQVIYHLVKERGFTLEGAKNELKRQKEHHDRKFKAIATLRELKTFLQELKKQL